MAAICIEMALKWRRNGVKMALKWR